MARQKYGGMLLGQMDDQIASYGMDPSREVGGAAANDGLRVCLPGGPGEGGGDTQAEGGGQREGAQADPGALRAAAPVLLLQAQRVIIFLTLLLLLLLSLLVTSLISPPFPPCHTGPLRQGVCGLHA